MNVRRTFSAAANAAPLIFCLHAPIASACGPKPNAAQVKIALAMASREGPAQNAMPVGAKNASDSCGVSPSPAFAKFIHGLRDSGLDLVLVMQGQEAMNETVHDIDRATTSLLSTLQCMVPSARVGAVLYFGRNDGLMVEPLTSRAAKLHSFLNRDKATGCGSWPEGTLKGIRTAIREMNWRPNVRKVIVLVDDDPPDKSDVKPILALIRKFKAAGGTFSTVDVAPQEYDRFEHALWQKLHHQEPPKSALKLPDFDKQTRAAFISLAKAGGGTMRPLMPHESIGQLLLTLAIGEQWEEQVAEFGKRIASGGASQAKEK